MLKYILRSFAGGYGRTMGRKAAHATGWLAIPLLVLVVVVGLMEIVGPGVGFRELLPFLSGGW
jgi:hypothetical protein